MALSSKVQSANGMLGDASCPSKYSTPRWSSLWIQASSTCVTIWALKSNPSAVTARSSSVAFSHSKAQAAGRRPRSSHWFTSAADCTSTSARVPCPFDAATISAVRPPAPARLGLALLSSNAVQIGISTTRAARTRGGSPPSGQLSKSAPFEANTRTSSGKLCCTAMSKADWPVTSSWTLTLALISVSSSSTSSGWPFSQREWRQSATGRPALLKRSFTTLTSSS
mmetsp:Transcript_52027/g.114175  ORF Transcript_52027/g.114175 Transcript_52027/m.114175 type:complete len:225 (+) Transcript_52027:273-947(+)